MDFISQLLQWRETKFKMLKCHWNNSKGFVSKWLTPNYNRTYQITKSVHISEDVLKLTWKIGVIFTNTKLQQNLTQHKPCTQTSHHSECAIILLQGIWLSQSAIKCYPIECKLVSCQHLEPYISIFFSNMCPLGTVEPFHWQFASSYSNLVKATSKFWCNFYFNFFFQFNELLDFSTWVLINTAV